MRARVDAVGGWYRGLDPIRVDGVLAAFLFAVSVFDILTESHRHDPLTGIVASGALAFAVAVRRRWLLQALVVVACALALRIAVAGPHGSLGPSGLEGSLMALLLFYAAGAYLGGWRSLAALAFGLGLISLSAVTGGNPVVGDLVWSDAALAGLPWLIARGVRERSARAEASRLRSERLDAEREQRVRVAALGERARLAREVHDVIAHSVSVMVIQAAGARAVMEREPGRAGEALDSVQRCGRDALAEMRRLLGVLGDGGQLRELAPQPGLADLGDLIERTCEAGLRASIAVIGEPVPVPPGLGLCVYRVVQEALTNTIKHARAGRAEVCLRWGADGLELEVVDDGDGGAAAPPGAFGVGGHGLLGMRERAALHGGTIEAGTADGGGFCVRAWIPIASQVAA